MKRSIRSVVVALIGASALLALGVSRSSPAIAFDKAWSFACGNVAAGDSGLWDDAPGAGVNNESAFMWFVTDQPANEFCLASASGGGVSTTTYTELYVRVAVSDGATFKVVVIPLPAEFCADTGGLGSAVVSGVGDNSAFTNLAVPLAAGSAALVCVYLNDDPDSVGSARASALIDEIKIWSPRSGLSGWRERFSN
jgi:hypothetical protein